MISVSRPIDNELDALAHELVVERRGFVLEREQALAARLFGERDERRDDVALVEIDLDERRLETADVTFEERASGERQQSRAESATRIRTMAFQRPKMTCRSVPPTQSADTIAPNPRIRRRFGKVQRTLLRSKKGVGVS